jgi:hypothetical protein
MDWFHLINPTEQVAYFYQTIEAEATSGNSSLFNHNELKEKCPL